MSCAGRWAWAARTEFMKRSTRGTAMHSFFEFLLRRRPLVLSLAAVVEARERNNANAAGGFIVRGWEQTYIRGLGQLSGPEDIGEVVLKSVDGVRVRVRDGGGITVAPQTRQ